MLRNAGAYDSGSPDDDALPLTCTHRHIYGIQSLPTLLLINNGDVVNRLVGAVPKQRLVDSIEEALANVSR